MKKECDDMMRWKNNIRMTLAVCMLAWLTACGIGGQNETRVDLQQVADKLLAEVTFAEPLEKIDMDIAMKQYGVNAEMVQNGMMYTGTAAAVDEISLWQAADASGSKAILEAVNERIESQKKSYTDYRPEEVPKLEDCVVVSKGNVVILCVSEDSQTARKILNDLL